MKQNNIHVIIHNYIESIYYVLCILDEYLHKLCAHHNYLISQHYA